MQDFPISQDASHSARLFETDAAGQAALLLVESLIHGLIARSVISVADAVEIVNVAVEVNHETAAELGDKTAAMQRSLSMLNLISKSLSSDL